MDTAGGPDRTHRPEEVLGTENPADLLTKHGISRERLGQLINLFNCGFEEGRPGSAPMLRTGSTGRSLIAEAHISEDASLDINDNLDAEDEASSFEEAPLECHI